MSAVLKPNMTVDAFIAWALDRDGRYELEDGVVIMMAPERSFHSQVKGVVFQELRSAVRTAGLLCRALPHGPTVRIDATTAFEPDALVYCGPRAPRNDVEVPNPVIVVEVLSPSTERRDRSTKVAGYGRVPSIHHYLIVDPDRASVTHHRRQGDLLVSAPVPSDGRLTLDPPGLTVDIAAFFAEDE